MLRCLKEYKFNCVVQKSCRPGLLVNDALVLRIIYIIINGDSYILFNFMPYCTQMLFSALTIELSVYLLLYSSVLLPVVHNTGSSR